MSVDTKDKILKTSLKLFSERGYAGTSMSDIANALGITKAALYKHYAGKQEILDSIIERMQANDFDNAERSGMPQCVPEREAEKSTADFADKIGEYSKTMFGYWTNDEFASRFRKLLTIEQFSDSETNKLYHNYLATGPLDYMTAVFGEITGEQKKSARLAFEFYGAMFLFYSVYDGASDKKFVAARFNDYTDDFIKELKEKYRKKGE